METKSRICKLFPRGVNNIVWDYFASTSKNPFDKGFHGEYEACSHIFDIKNGRKAMLGACAGGWIHIINCMMLRGLHEFSNEAIKFGIKYNQVEVVRFLLKSHYYEPLSTYHFDTCMKRCNIEIIQLLVKKGYLKEIVQYSQVLLISALKRKDVIAIDYALSLKNENLDLDLDSCKAVAFEEIDKIQEMIAKNTFNPMCCLEIVCSNGNCEVINILKLFNYSQFEKYHALNEAIKQNYIEVFKLMELNSSYYNGQLLLKALKKNHLDVAKMLIRSKPEYNLYTVYKFGDITLLKFVFENQPEWQYGFNEVALGMHDDVERTNLLLEYLRNRNQLETINMFNSITKCCRKNNHNVLTLLLNVAMKLHNYFHADDYFREACRNGNIECVKIMIEYGAKSFEQGSHLARLNGHFELEKELKSLYKKRKFVL